MKTSKNSVRLSIPLLFRIFAFEAFLLCGGTIGFGLFFVSGIYFIDELSIAIFSLIFGIVLVLLGVCLTRHFLPNLLAKVTVTDEVITWKFMFWSIDIRLDDIKYTDVTDYKHPGIVPYLVIATKSVGDISLDNLKRGKNLIFFQLYDENIAILHSVIPKPYNQVLNKYIKKSKHK